MKFWSHNLQTPGVWKVSNNNNNNNSAVCYTCKMNTLFDVINIFYCSTNCIMKCNDSDSYGINKSFETIVFLQIWFLWQCCSHFIIKVFFLQIWLAKKVMIWTVLTFHSLFTAILIQIDEIITGTLTESLN